MIDNSLIPCPFFEGGFSQNDVTTIFLGLRDKAYSYFGKQDEVAATCLPNVKKWHAGTSSTRMWGYYDPRWVYPLVVGNVLRGRLIKNNVFDPKYWYQYGINGDDELIFIKSKCTEEAYEKACAMLGVDPADAEFEVLETEEKKRFGLFGGRPAKVRAFIRSTPADAAAEYLRNVLSGMGLGDVNIEIREEEAGAELVLTGENIGFIIGHRGETLDSLQYLASLVANHVDESYYRITLDVGNYREKRKETLENLGRKMAARAVKTGRNASLEPMNPYERRIIHTAVQEVEGAKSWSEGEDLARHVVIGPEGGERYVRRDNRRGGNNRGRNGGYNRDNRGGRAPRRDNRDSRPAQNRTAPAAPRVLDDVSTPYGKISKN